MNKSAHAYKQISGISCSGHVYFGVYLCIYLYIHIIHHTIYIQSHVCVRSHFRSSCAARVYLCRSTNLQYLSASFLQDIKSSWLTQRHAWSEWYPMEATSGIFQKLRLYRLQVNAANQHQLGCPTHDWGTLCCRIQKWHRGPHTSKLLLCSKMIRCARGALHMTRTTHSPQASALKQVLTRSKSLKLTQKQRASRL